MTASHPPRLAIALLHRVFDADEPLVGDLIEDFERHRSRAWFWQQTVSAVAFRWRQPSDHSHPLGLAPRAESLRLETESIRTPRPTINLSASPVMHAGGLGVVAFITLTAIVRPQAWWMFVPAVAGGILLAIAMIVFRRRHERG